MPRIHCNGFGQTADGKKCDLFDLKNMVCTGDGGCALSHTMLTDDEIATREAINLPVAIEELKAMRQGSIGISQILSYRNDISEPINISLSIIDKMNPHKKAHGDYTDPNTYEYMERYWEDPTAIDFDMGMLSAMKARLDVQTAIAGSAVANSKEALKIAKFDKTKQIYDSFRTGIRTERLSDQWVKTLAEIDPQIKQAQAEVHKARQESEIIHSMATTIESHINVMKKRLDSLRGEKSRDSKRG